MLGYVLAEGRGEADLILADVAGRLEAAGWNLTGVVQINQDHPVPGRACHMDLAILQGNRRIRISQDLGALAQGCRLDPSALETAVGLVEGALDAEMAGGPRLLIVNKFGKQETEGRGFRPVIGRAMAMGLPVLVAVNSGNMAAFHVFAEGIGAALPADAEAVIGWCNGLTQG